MQAVEASLAAISDELLIKIGLTTLRPQLRELRRRGMTLHIPTYGGFEPTISISLN